MHVVGDKIIFHEALALPVALSSISGSTVVGHADYGEPHGRVACNCQIIGSLLGKKRYRYKINAIATISKRLLCY
jgi:hypothetical protein